MGWTSVAARTWIAGRAYPHQMGGSTKICPRSWDTYLALALQWARMVSRTGLIALVAVAVVYVLTRMTGPQAVANVNNLGTGEFQLDGSASTSDDPENDPIASYEWTVEGICDSGSTINDDATYTGVTATHISACDGGVGGDYTFTLTITTQNGRTASDTVFERLPA